MSQSMTIQEAAVGLADLVHSLNDGDEIILTENDREVARIVPSARKRSPRVPGLWKGKLIILKEDDEHLEDFKEYMP